MIYGRLLPLPDREPSLAAARVSPTSAAIQSMQAQALRDMGRLGDRELARFELALGGLPQGRHLFNPFTGEYRWQSSQ